MTTPVRIPTAEEIRVRYQQGKEAVVAVFEQLLVFIHELQVSNQELQVSIQELQARTQALEDQLAKKQSQQQQTSFQRWPEAAEDSLAAQGQWEERWRPAGTSGTYPETRGASRPYPGSSGEPL